MQTPKEEIRQNILLAAKEEFLKKGFEKASVRTITANAGTSKSNVYNYFENKDALFSAVVEPVLSGIKEGFCKVRYENRHKNASYSLTAQKEIMCAFMNFVYVNVEYVKLLLFHAGGSSLSGFKDDVIEQLAGVLIDWLRTTAPKKNISELLSHSVAGFYVNSVELMLKQEKTRQQAVEHLDEFLKFVYGGWNTILNS